MKNLAVLLTGVVLCAPAFATLTSQASGTVGGQSVDAEAFLTFGTNTLTITIENLEVNPRSDIQSINGISFDLPGLTTSTAVSDTSFSGTDISDITDNTANGWTTKPDSTNHWILTPGTNTFDMTTIGNSMAPYTIIGGPNSANKYTNANSSITNNVHDPFLLEVATWTLNISGVTAASANEVSDVVFYFGTDSGSSLEGEFITPEPGSFALGAFGLAGVVALAVRRRRSSRA